MVIATRFVTARHKYLNADKGKSPAVPQAAYALPHTVPPNARPWSTIDTSFATTLEVDSAVGQDVEAIRRVNVGTSDASSTTSLDGQWHELRAFREALQRFVTSAKPNFRLRRTKERNLGPEYEDVGMTVKHRVEWFSLRRRFLSTFPDLLLRHVPTPSATTAIGKSTPHMDEPREEELGASAMRTAIALMQLHILQMFDAAQARSLLLTRPAPWDPRPADEYRPLCLTQAIRVALQHLDAERTFVSRLLTWTSFSNATSITASTPLKASSESLRYRYAVLLEDLLVNRLGLEIDEESHIRQNFATTNDRTTDEGIPRDNNVTSSVTTTLPSTALFLDPVYVARLVTTMANYLGRTLTFAAHAHETFALTVQRRRDQIASERASNIASHAVRSAQFQLADPAPWQREPVSIPDGLLVTVLSATDATGALRPRTAWTLGRALSLGTSTSSSTTTAVFCFSNDQGIIVDTSRADIVLKLFKAMLGGAGTVMTPLDNTTDADVCDVLELAVTIAGANPQFFFMGGPTASPPLPTQQADAAALHRHFRTLIDKVSSRMAAIAREHSVAITHGPQELRSDRAGGEGTADMTVADDAPLLPLRRHLAGRKEQLLVVPNQYLYHYSLEGYRRAATPQQMPSSARFFRLMHTLQRLEQQLGSVEKTTRVGAVGSDDFRGADGVSLIDDSPSPLLVAGGKRNVDALGQQWISRLAIELKSTQRGEGTAVFAYLQDVIPLIRRVLGGGGGGTSTSSESGDVRRSVPLDQPLIDEAGQNQRGRGGGTGGRGGRVRAVRTGLLAGVRDLLRSIDAVCGQRVDFSAALPSMLIDLLCLFADAQFQANCLDSVIMALSKQHARLTPMEWFQLLTVSDRLGSQSGALLLGACQQHLAEWSCETDEVASGEASQERSGAVRPLLSVAFLTDTGKSAVFRNIATRPGKAADPTMIPIARRTATAIAVSRSAMMSSSFADMDACVASLTRAVNVIRALATIVDADSGLDNSGLRGVDKRLPSGEAAIHVLFEFSSRATGRLASLRSTNLQGRMSSSFALVEVVSEAVACCLDVGMDSRCPSATKLSAALLALKLQLLVEGVFLEVRRSGDPFLCESSAHTAAVGTLLGTQLALLTAIASHVDPRALSRVQRETFRRAVAWCNAAGLSLLQEGTKKQCSAATVNRAKSQAGEFQSGRGGDAKASLCWAIIEHHPRPILSTTDGSRKKQHDRARKRKARLGSPLVFTLAVRRLVSQLTTPRSSPSNSFFAQRLAAVCKRNPAVRIAAEAAYQRLRR